MSANNLLGARIALRWSTFITMAGPSEACENRRAEIASDVFEHVASARAIGVSQRHLSWSITERVLRGLPRDIAWRLRLEATPARYGWHVRHPSTLLTFLLVMIMPLNVIADSARTRVSALFPFYDGLWALTLATCWLLIAFAVAAGAHRAFASGDSMPSPVPKGSTRWARNLTAVMAISWAASAVWRIGPYSSFHTLSSMAWATFGVSLLAYLALLLARSGAKLLTLGR